MKVSVRSNRMVLAGILVLVSLLLFTSHAMAGCRSYAYEKKDAIAFCEKKLKCKAPEIVACYGQPREWKCRCEKPKEKPKEKPVEKPEKKVEQHEKKVEQLEQKKEQSDYSIKKEMDKSSPKLMEDK